jgi:SAM-dependent methyltransferase
MSSSKVEAEEWGSRAKAEAAQRWERPSAYMGRGVTEALLEAAAARSGMEVLDVASGTGAPALHLARQVGPKGRVTATDIAREPLAIAAQRAEERGLVNIVFERTDVQELAFPEQSFDLVTCRFGVMFFPDLARALREMRRVLRPGGRVALLAWGPMEQPYFTSTIGVALKHLPGVEVPAPARAMFKFGDGRTLSAALAAAGFQQAGETMRSVPWVWTDSVEELWAYFQVVTVPFKPLLEKVPAAEREAVGREVCAELARYWDGKQVKLTAQVVVATGAR